MNINITMYYDLGFDFEGYFDNYKTKDNVFRPDDNIHFDFVLINSPKYIDELCKQFPRDKVLIIVNNKIVRYAN